MTRHTKNIKELSSLTSLDTPSRHYVQNTVQNSKNRRYRYQYFEVDELKFIRFYLLPNIHEKMHSVSCSSVICNSGFYTGNISAFLAFHLKSIVIKVKSYIKDTSDSFKKLDNLPELPDDVISCTTNLVRLYTNSKKDYRVLKKVLDKQQKKTVSTESLIELAEIVLKNNYFEFNGRFTNKKRVLL